MYTRQIEPEAALFRDMILLILGSGAAACLVVKAIVEFIG